MKKSNYENSVFPYSLHSTVNLYNPTNVTLMSFLRLFTETITYKENSFFFKIT